MNPNFTLPKAGRVVVLGGGESGVGAALLAKAKGYEVFVSDGGKLKPNYRAELEAGEIAFEEGTHTFDRLTGADIYVKSPGLPDKAQIVQALVAEGADMISEIEFAYHFAIQATPRPKIVAITGTNGKTTTTLLLYHILERYAMDAGLAGNVGKSWARQIADGTHPTHWVLELSSFQLDGCRAFCPDVAILANITPDHLDRYASLEAYAESKMQICANQREGQAFIYSSDDPLTESVLDRVPKETTLLPFSVTQWLEFGASPAEHQASTSPHEYHITLPHNLTAIMPPIFQKEQTMSFNQDDLALNGKHNLANSMAAGIAAKLLEVRNKSIRESLSSFDNIEHRMEFVASIQGVDFINDSKGTNVNSTWYALESVNRPIVWIAGGVDKGNDYASLLPLAQERVKALVALGKDNRRIEEAFSETIPNIVTTQDMVEAVRLAMQLAEKGDVVLLSPACASFDLFDNFEHRGLAFKDAVKSL